MSFIQIINTFTFYGFDVILLAVLTAFAVQIIKVTLFKKCSKKLLTLMPFFIGTLLYAAYSAIINLSVSHFLTEYTKILEHGVAVGSISTLLYVLYEQFVREKSNASATEGIISTLIEGYVPTDSVESVAKKIATAIEKDVTGSGATKAAQIIAENSGEEISERDIQLLSKLIIETLAHTTAIHTKQP